MKKLFWMAGLLGALAIPVAAQNTRASSFVRMNRDCGIVGSGDETTGLNTCIANLSNYSTLECDKPMTISTTGMIVNDKRGIVIRTGAGHHALDGGSYYCRINYIGSAAGTVVDWDRVRDSKLQGFTITMNAADLGIWIRQNGSGSNISTADTFEDLMVNNNNGRSTATGYKVGDPSGQNCDEMTFRRAGYLGNGTTPAGTAFNGVHVNVKGTRFEDIVIIGAAIGWNWVGYGDYVVMKGNGYAIGTLYVGQAPWFISQDDYEGVTMVADLGPTGEGGYSAARGRYATCTPNSGMSCPWSGLVTGTAGHPAFRASGSMFIDTTNVKLDYSYGAMVGCTTSCSGTVYRGFADPGAITFGNFRYNPATQISKESWSWTGARNSGGGNNWTGWNLIDFNGNGVRGIGMYEDTSAGLALTNIPCAQGNPCISDGQAEFTGIHSILNTPTVSYTGTAGTADRTYRIMACSANPCSAGTRSIPSPGVATFAHTQAKLDGRNYVTLTWIPSFGAVSYSILEQNPRNNEQFNELMTGVTCATNPCTVNVTTNSSTYTYAYPAYNETGGAILRGVIKFGKSATQPALLDFTNATVTAFPASSLTSVPLTYNHSGRQQTAAHLVVDSCTLGTDCSVTLTGAAVFSSASSYTCTCQDETAVASCKVAQSSGSAFTITGTGTDSIRYSCAGN